MMSSCLFRRDLFFYLYCQYLSLRRHICSEAQAYGERIGPGDARGAEVPVSMGVLTLGRQAASMAICDLGYCGVSTHDEEVTDMSHKPGTFGLAALSQFSASRLGLFGQWTFTALGIRSGYKTSGLYERQGEDSRGIMGVDGLFGSARDIRYNL